MTLAPLLPRDDNWVETADFNTIHYMAAIRSAKELALAYQDRKLLTVVLAVPLDYGREGFTYAAEVVPTNRVFAPYPRGAVVLHVVAINDAGEPALLPETLRLDIPERIAELCSGLGEVPSAGNPCTLVLD